MTTAETVARQYRRILLSVARGDEDKVQEALLYLVGHPTESVERAVGLACLHIKCSLKMEYRHDSVVSHGLALVAVESEREDTTAARIAIYKALPKIRDKYRTILEQYLQGIAVNKDMLYRAKIELRSAAVALL